MIALPPLNGAVQDTVACVSPAVAVAPVGGSGTVGAAGITEFEAADGLEGPTVLVATTLNVYDTPSVRPVTVVDVAPNVDAVPPAGIYHGGAVRQPNLFGLVHEWLTFGAGRCACCTWPNVPLVLDPEPQCSD